MTGIAARTAAQTVVAMCAVAAFATMAAAQEAAPRPGLGPGGQDMRERPITDLLNRLSQRSYAEYGSVERRGDVYVIEARTRDFRPVTVELDVRTGEIREIE